MGKAKNESKIKKINNWFLPWFFFYVNKFVKYEIYIITNSQHIFTKLTFKDLIKQKSKEMTIYDKQ